MIAAVCSESLFRLVEDANFLYHYPLRHIFERNPRKILDLLQKEEYSFVVVELEYPDNPLDETVEQLQRLHLAGNAKIIVVAQGYESDSIFLRALATAGLTTCITDVFPTAIKRRLIEYLNGSGKADAPFPASDAVLLAPEEKPPRLFRPAPRHKTHSVAVCGALSRIGTTTQALQAAAWLRMQGKKVCYLEMNRSGYVKQFQKIYDEAVDDSNIGCVRIDYNELYYRPERITEILKKEYDFILYDFGCFEKMDFVPYLEKDVKLIVCGCKPQELEPLMDVFEAFDREQVHYLFSFAPAGDQLSIREQMGEKSGMTFFPAYSPSLFYYNSDNSSIHQKILGPYLETAEEAEKPAKRFSLFRR